MGTPTEAELARARALVAAKSDAEVLALCGNWRPLRVPPLAEFVRHTLIVEKESGKLIPFELWPAQSNANANAKGASQLPSTSLSIERSPAFALRKGTERVMRSTTAAKASDGTIVSVVNGATLCFLWWL